MGNNQCTAAVAMTFRRPGQPDEAHHRVSLPKCVAHGAGQSREAAGARKVKKFLQRDAVFKVEGDQVSLA